MLTLIQQIRFASRTMVRELGFMKSTLAGTSYSPSAVHTLLEIEAHGAITSAQLVQILDLEKSTVSRMVAKLIEAGEIIENSDNQDGRIKRLLLTAKGKKNVSNIHAYSEMQVQSALNYLNPMQQQSVADSLLSYAQALQKCRLSSNEKMQNDITIVDAYIPGIVGRIAEMHANFYSRHSNLGQFFESKVATGIAEFVSRLNKPCNKIWAVLQNSRIVGSIAIDGENLGNNNAHLRWFILDDGCRGSGIDRQLLNKALEFVDEQNFSATQLWTVKGLDSARRLYESSGFVLVHEEQGEQWGSTMIEQQFTRIAADGNIK